MTNTMQVPVFQLQKQFRAIEKEVLASARRVLRGGSYIMGRNVSAFEEEFARYCGARYAVGVASGTDALILALRASGIGRGDEVITAAFTFFASAEAISSVGATVVFADIDPNTHTIDPEEIRKKITRKTKAILCVHLYGQPCDMSSIGSLAKRYGLKLIEDCAQAAGAEFKGRKVGTFADAGCFSFYPTKNLGAYGDGGMVTTNTRSTAERLRMLRWYGSRDRVHYQIHGYNSRLDELQAALLRVKLKYLDRWNEARREAAFCYERCLRSLEEKGLLTLPRERKNARHVFHLYVVRVRQRRKLMDHLRRCGITTAIHYPVALHRQKVYQPLGYRASDFPHAVAAARRVVTLPLYPELSREEIGYVASSITAFFTKGKSRT